MHNGRLVCGGNELCIYDEQKDEFHTYPSLDFKYILSLAVDSSDNLYVATNTSIYRYNPQLTKIQRLDAPFYNDFITGSDGIMPMHVDWQGRLWISRNGDGIMWVDMRTEQHRLYSPDKLSNGIVRCITEDHDHNIWLGTEHGITIIDPNDGISFLQHRFDESNGLGDNAIYSILCDRYNNMWVGSYFGGVDLLQRSSTAFHWYEPGFGNANLKGKVPRMMVETSPSIFYIATEDGGLNALNSLTGAISLVSGIKGMGTNIHSLYFDDATNNLWIGTFRHGLFRYNLTTHQTKRYEANNSIFYIVRQRNGRLWIASTQGLYYLDERADQLHSFSSGPLRTCFVYTLAVDSQDNLWAGTSAYGLFRIDGRTGRVMNWRRGTSGLKDNYITSLYPNGKHIWIGTNSYGLQYLELKTYRIEQMHEGDHLDRSTVCSITTDHQGILWVSASSGLYRLNRETGKFVRFTMENGLPTNLFNFSSALCAHDGQLYFGTVRGLVSFNPRAIAGRSRPVDVHFKSLSFNNTEVSAASENSPLKTDLDHSDEIVLSYEQAQAHSFAIEYGVVLPAKADGVEYQIYLEGIDKDWHNVGKERRFYTSSLGPGTYYLHVRASLETDNWANCPERTLKIIVRPPFYRSLWAYLIYILLLTAGIWGALRFTRNKIRDRNALRMAQMEKQKVEELDREKVSFFTSVSHELKTPLSLIVAPLKSLSHQKLNQDAQHQLDMALKNTRTLERLINDLVTFNKVQTDNFPFYIQKGNPLEFIDLMVKSYFGLAQEKKLHLSLDLENNGEEVWFSPSYVESILANLLSNAFKFTPPSGYITVKACITTQPKDPWNYLRVSVTDTGIGIAKEELPNLFDRFYQTKRGYNVNHNGWGIGLSLVKRLATVHKGKVSVESEMGKGSTFTVMLNVSGDAFDANSRITDDKVIVPVQQYKFSFNGLDMPSDKLQQQEMEQAEDKPVLLIVDDNEDLLSFLKDYFQKNYKVITATNGREALEIARQQAVGLVISDVMMPEMDGIELCRTLKGDVQTSHIPIILLTAKGGQDEVVEGYRSGAEAYVAKPFDPEVLELQVKNIIGLQKSRQNEIVNTQDNNLDATSLSDIDKDFLHRINELVEQHLGDSNFSVAEITDTLSISRSLLHTKMKNLVNMSMGDYIRKRRLDHACSLLRQGYNVSETAYRTGFADPSYFSKTFKKHIGVSPTEYASNQNTPQ